MKNNKKINVLGVKFDKLSKKQVIEIIEKYLINKN